MGRDPWLELVIARRAYIEAVAARDGTSPGTPGYHEAVHRVGVAWTRVQRWEREVAKQRRTDG